jgi:large subunit ribosomal protein L24e
MDCNFCGQRIPAGTEYIYVSNKGKASYLCSSKCFKNLIRLDRKPRDVKWTKAYAQEKEARLKSQEHKGTEPHKPAEAPKQKGQKTPKEHKVEAEKTPDKKEKADSGKKEIKKPKKPAKK